MIFCKQDQTLDSCWSLFLVLNDNDILHSLI